MSEPDVKLEPCPFCGGNACAEASSDHSTAWEIGCYNDKCAVQPHAWEVTTEQAIAAWNRRPSRADGGPAGVPPGFALVPVEPTEEQSDAPRQIILYAETPARSIGGLRRHLLCCGIDYSWFPHWAKYGEGHLTKGGIADLVYRAMLAAAPPRPLEGGGK